MLPTADTKFGMSVFVTKSFRLSRLVNSFISNLYSGITAEDSKTRREWRDGVRKEDGKYFRVK